MIWLDTDFILLTVVVSFNRIYNFLLAGLFWWYLDCFIIDSMYRYHCCQEVDCIRWRPAVIHRRIVISWCSVCVFIRR